MQNILQKGVAFKSRNPSNFWHTIDHIFKTTSARDFTFGIQLQLRKAERALK